MCQLIQTGNHRGNMIKNIKILEGKNIIKAIGVKEPLSWEDEEETVPIFGHKDLPFSQLSALYLWAQNNEVYKLATFQNDDMFTLGYIGNVSETELELESFESNELIELTGQLSGEVITVVQEYLKDNLFKVFLEFRDKRVGLASGEVEPSENEICIRALDESILFYEKGEDLQFTVFNESYPFKLL
ncbi:hypothetical protein BMS_3094 [Halobacteriovorax marinus SJ]|uniref:Uncharacterized protein n=2 Tax=Halobacteriovorax marinus TaxID=97084 RepID=E1WZG3_HALMS|nr:hypothetical protein BMS_3094 [Halobacteriovorax marinus SJ]